METLLALAITLHCGDESNRSMKVLQKASTIHSLLNALAVTWGSIFSFFYPK